MLPIIKHQQMLNHFLQLLLSVGRCRDIDEHKKSLTQVVTKSQDILYFLNTKNNALNYCISMFAKDLVYIQRGFHFVKTENLQYNVVHIVFRVFHNYSLSYCVSSFIFYILCVPVFDFQFFKVSFFVIFFQCQLLFLFIIYWCQFFSFFQCNGFVYPIITNFINHCKH